MQTIPFESEMRHHILHPGKSAMQRTGSRRATPAVDPGAAGTPFEAAPHGEVDAKDPVQGIWAKRTPGGQSIPKQGPSAMNASAGRLS